MQADSKHHRHRAEAREGWLRERLLHQPACPGPEVYRAERVFQDSGEVQGAEFCLPGAWTGTQGGRVARLSLVREEIMVEILSQRGRVKQRMESVRGVKLTQTRCVQDEV